MDNEEIAGVKFSQFPSATPGDSDEVVGLHAGDNARFSVANFILAIRQGLVNIFVPKTDVGTANGVAGLDSTGKVPSSQLPPISSDDITYDPTTSGASSANVKDALDEAFDDLDGKQDEITASGILKGDGQGGVSAATPGTDYQAPLTIDSTPTASSTNPVQSGGVYTDVRTRVPVNGMGKNLLDNANFLNPVNQRGAMSGAAGYSIDRWSTSYGSGGVSWSLTSSGLTFQPTNPSSYGYICQVIDNEILSALTGKRISVYVLTSDGDVIGGVVPYTSNVLIYDATYDGHRVRIRFSGSEFRIESFASALTVCAVKLEIGTDQTLAHQENGDWVLNEIPDYEYELYRCITSTADPSDTYANKSLATEQQLAYVETGTTASQNYTAGQYISLNGVLYTADTAIASGATFYTSGGNKNLTECVGGGFNALRSAIGVTTTVGINTRIDGYGFYILNITPPKTGAIPFACGLTSVYSWFKGSFGIITDAANGSPGILVTNLESSSKIFEGTLTVYWITL